MSCLNSITSQDTTPKMFKPFQLSSVTESYLTNHLSSTQKSRLLALPAELRNQIYTLLLGHKSICLSSSSFNGRRVAGEIAACHYPPLSGYSEQDAQSGVLTLLLVCRQIYAEARHLIFTANVFRYSNAAQNVQVWHEQRTEDLARIETLRMYSSGFVDESTWLAGLKYFPGLKRVEVAMQGRGPRPAKADRGPWGKRTQWESDFEASARREAGESASIEVVFYVTYDEDTIDRVFAPQKRSDDTRSREGEGEDDGTQEEMEIGGLLD